MSGHSKLTPVGKAAPVLAGKVSVRYRKTTASWVIYHKGSVVESGFDSEKSARDYLDDWFAIATLDTQAETV